MPTITPQARVQINSDPENFQQPRRTIVQSTQSGSGKLEPFTSTGAVNLPKKPVQNGQTVTPEETTAPAVTLSPQLTALARQQQKLQKEIQAQRDKEASWEKEKAGYIPKEQIQVKAKKNAEEALKEAMGMSYEELTNLVLTQQNGGDPVAALSEEVKALKASQEENANKQFDAVIRQYKNEAKTLIQKDPTKFAFLEANPEWVDGAVQYIVDEWEADENNVISLDDALALAEENLRDDAKKQSAVWDKINKPAEATEEVPAVAKRSLPPPKTTAARTLTHAVESAPTRSFNQFQHMSMKERIAAAVARASK